VPSQKIQRGMNTSRGVKGSTPGVMTLADTSAGQALSVQLQDGVWTVVERVDASTNWLQDVYRHEHGWILVDGAQARVLHLDDCGNIVQVHQFDREWCLYEALPWG